MKIITVAAQKGGTGKTTTASAIGAGLSIRGSRVLYIDLDAQGNLTASTGAIIGKEDSLTLLTGKTVQPQHTPQGDIISSTSSLSVADITITQTGKEYRLKEALDSFSVIYDYCIVDTPPALGILTVNALTAASTAIIPAQADFFSMQAIAQLNETISAVKKYCNPKLEISGIVLTRYNQRAILSREVAELLEHTAEQLRTRLYNTKIRECMAIKEAQAKKQSIFAYAPKSNAAKDYSALIDELTEIKKEI